MQLVPKLLLALAFTTLATSCTGSGPRKQINPPRASIQELAVQANGQWLLTVRVQNFSNVPTAFASINAILLVAGQEAGTLALPFVQSVGPESADVVTTTINPTLAAKSSVASALATGQSVNYQLSGKIIRKDPSGTDTFSYESVLHAAPGLNGVMR